MCIWPEKGLNTQKFDLSQQYIYMRYLNTYPFVGKRHIKPQEEDRKQWSADSAIYRGWDLDDNVTKDRSQVRQADRQDPKYTGWWEGEKVRKSFATYVYREYIVCINENITYIRLCVTTQNATYIKLLHTYVP